MPECSSSPSRLLLQALGEFNRGCWFECHETLEELWVGEQGELRDFYQGILQIAVALHHWRNGNFGGAVSLLEGGARYLRRVSGVCQRIDVAALIAESDKVRETLGQLGRERMSELPAELIPRLRLTDTSLT
ncbi:DUF309 domain-containing protein [Geobacter sp. SVR]|uniref:DUF309 domain-containing protein n=1 Tax=Geobacter sp. SVR TaxID=2495594 RepID=UPI00143F0537|nr:DUF309 domain-containing protein [Geobacter sp. SVR]BCS53972.1 hypothetical protein GSVR_22800 [Geobacter sp. SVR]GCF86247.1 hypothetical protein GSbR_28470 [Geobacter sp. SVR]